MCRGIFIKVSCVFYFLTSLVSCNASKKDTETSTNQTMLPGDNFGVGQWEQIPSNIIPEFGYTQFINESVGYGTIEEKLYMTENGGKDWKLTDTFGDANVYATIEGIQVNFDNIIIQTTLLEKADFDKRRLVFYKKNLATGLLVELSNENLQPNFDGKLGHISPLVRSESGGFIAYESESGYRLSKDGEKWQDIPMVPGYGWVDIDPDFSIKPDGTITTIRHDITYLDRTDLNDFKANYCTYSPSSPSPAWACRSTEDSDFSVTNFFTNLDGIQLSMVGGILNSWPTEKTRYSGPISYTRDGGQSWEPSISEKYVLCSQAIYVTSSYIIAACERIVDNYHSDSVLYLSTDGGVSWNEELMKAGGRFDPTIRVVDRKSLKEVFVSFEYWLPGEKKSRSISFKRSIII